MDVNLARGPVGTYTLQQGSSDVCAVKRASDLDTAISSAENLMHGVNAAAKRLRTLVDKLGGQQATNTRGEVGAQPMPPGSLRVLDSYLHGATAGLEDVHDLISRLEEML